MECTILSTSHHGLTKRSREIMLLIVQRVQEGVYQNRCTHGMETSSMSVEKFDSIGEVDCPSSLCFHDLKNSSAEVVTF